MCQSGVVSDPQSEEVSIQPSYLPSVEPSTTDETNVLINENNANILTVLSKPIKCRLDD